MTTERALDLLHELEWRRCRDDPVYFVSQFCWIKHPEGARLIPMRDVQREILTVWLESRATVSLKARQIGWSTIASLYSLWVAMFGEGRKVILLSRGQEFAREVLSMATFAYSKLPDWMVERAPLSNQTLEKLNFENGSGIESLPSKKDPARGKTAHTLFADEMAFFEQPELQWPSLLPVVDVGGSLHILSSANGGGTFFEDLYVDAKEGRNGFKAMFYSWRVVPERDDAWYEAQKLRLSEWQLHQEYPSDDTEAFIRSGHPVFDIDSLARTTPLPPRHGELADKDTFLEYEGGPLEMFTEPRPMETYVIGADTARGLGHGDFCCASVLKIPSSPSQPFVHCASLHLQVEPDLFGKMLYDLGRFYNDALLGVESNGHGLTTLVQLRDQHYPALFYRRILGARHDKRTKEMGWATSKKSKPLMMDELGEALRAGDLPVRCQATKRELMAYRRLPSGEMSGSPHDDRVVALAIAVQMAKHRKWKPHKAVDIEAAPFTGQWLIDQVKAENRRLDERPGSFLGAMNQMRGR